MKRLVWAVIFGGLLAAAALIAQQVFKVPQGGIGTSTIGGNDSLNSHLCKSADGTSVVTCVPPTPIPTNTHTSTPTVTPTNTPTSTTPTNTPTQTPTNTPTPTHTPTPVVGFGGWFGSAATAFLHNDSSTTVTSYMTVPNDTALEATTAVTVSAWVRPNVFVSSASYGIFTKATAAGGTGAAACGDYSMLITAAEVFFGVNGSGSCSWGSLAQWTPTGGNWSHSISSAPSGYWHHLVGTYDKVAAKIYVDGVLRATGGAYSTNLNHTGTIGVAFAWGVDKAAAAKECRCSIDQLGIWKDVALTAGDVGLLYRGGRALRNYSILSATPTVMWEFDEGNGQTATDSVSGLVLTAFSGTGFTPIEWVEGIVPTQ